MPILLADGKVTRTPVRPSEFLKQNRPGPYTSLVVHKRGEVPLWEEHFQRLQQSLHTRRSPQAACKWETSPWHQGNHRTQIDSCTLLAEVEEAAYAAKEGGSSQAVSVVILLEEHEGQAIPPA